MGERCTKPGEDGRERRLEDYLLRRHAEEESEITPRNEYLCGGENGREACAQDMA